MSSNRISMFLATDSDNRADPGSLRGFTVNPCACFTQPWQLQIYQEAFLQAQKKLADDSAPDFPWAESCK